MDLHALGQQVGSRFIATLVRDGKRLARSAGSGFMPGQQIGNHVLGCRHPFFFRDRCQSGVAGVRTRGRMAQRPDSLRDLIHGKRKLVVLLFEHQMERVKHGPFDVPVVVVRLEIERVAIGKHT